MLLDLQLRRIFSRFAVVGCLTATTGCHSTMLQPAATPAASSASQGPSASKPESAEQTQLTEQPQPVTAPPILPGPGPMTVVSTLDPPRIELASAADSLPPPLPPAAAASAQSSKPEGPKEPAPAPITAVVQAPPVSEVPARSIPPAHSSSATPLLEKALRRVEEMRLDTIREAATSEPAPKPVPAKPRADRAVVTVSAEAKPVKAPEKAKPVAVDKKAESSGPIAQLESPPEARPAKRDPKIQKASVEKKSPTQNTPDPTQVVVPPEGGTAERNDHLSITDARICRRVISFGSVEPLPEKTVKLGQTVVLYVELSGVKINQDGDVFRSQLASRLELHRADERGQAHGDPVWAEDADIAKDTCNHRRRDFWLNYAIHFPRESEPGKFILRLKVTDLASNQSATTQIPVTIAR